jgi:hypothetical protein
MQCREDFLLANFAALLLACLLAAIAAAFAASTAKLLGFPDPVPRWCRLDKQKFFVLGAGLFTVSAHVLLR